MTEDQLEQETLGWLAEVGYTPLFGPDLAPEGPAQERADYRQVLLRGSTLPRDFRPFSESASSTGAGFKAVIEKALWWHVCNIIVQT